MGIRSTKLTSPFTGVFNRTRNQGSNPPNPTYSITESTTSLNEGSSVTFTVTTTAVLPGSTLYWTTNTVSGTINTSDFNDASTSGSFTVTGEFANGTGSITRTLSNDVTTEGTESFQIQIREGSISGTIVATSNTITINDTSISGLTATGGSTFTPGNGYKYHVFTTPGTFTVTSGSLPGHVVVIAGGGSGGNCGNGGGGAGGLVMNPAFAFVPGSYPINIGPGGGPAGGCGPGNNGSPSIFGIPYGTPIIAVGGGAGGGNDSTAGNAGGSGGGGSYGQSGGGVSAPPNGPYPGWTIYGSSGGPGGASQHSGSGGGAGGSGGTDTNPPGAYGGSGLLIPQFNVPGMPTQSDGTGAGYFAAGSGSYQSSTSRQPNGAPGYTQGGRTASGDGSGGQPGTPPAGPGVIMIRYVPA